MKKLLLTIATACAIAGSAVAQSFTATFSVLTSDDGVDIYHVPVRVHITEDEILIGKKGSTLDVLFAHILHKQADPATNTITYTTEQGTVVYAIEGDCHAVTWQTNTFAWRLYSTVPEWVRVENKR